MLGFPFFAIGASSFREGREEKRDWKKKGDKEQNNSIRMLLDLIFFPLEICPLQRGGESSVPQDTT